MATVVDNMADTLAFYRICGLDIPTEADGENRVVIDLRTHDCDGISDRDFELARRIDTLA